MIAETLQNSVDRLRVLLARDNGDMAQAAPAVLDDLEADIERVRGLESVVCIEVPIARRPSYPTTGGHHDHA